MKLLEGNSVQCIEIVEKVVSAMMLNCGVTLLKVLKVAESGLSGTAEDYGNALNIAEVDGRSILVWRKLLGVEGMQKLDAFKEVGFMSSNK